MRFPGFFIIGAPKCGTTSLYEYLRLHPRIFMSYPKEPNHYNIDMPRTLRVPGNADYEALFARAPAGSLCGEASPWYLYSRKAVDGILRDNPNARFIACLRNPADMYVSFHGQILYNQKIGENPDPEMAWRKHLDYPDLGDRDDTFPDQPRYGKICGLGSQVKRLLARAPRDKIKFVLFEDIRRDARAVYESCLEFLGIESDGRIEFPVHNERKTHRFPALSRFLMHTPFPLNHVKRGIKKAVMVFNPNPGNIYNDVSFLSKPQPRPVLRPEFRRELISYFSDEVSLLEKMIDRDLSSWRATKAEQSVIASTAPKFADAR